VEECNERAKAKKLDDYVLSGHLEKLEEVDYDGDVKVEVALSAQMTNLSTV
jgi:hypothetical protein